MSILFALNLWWFSLTGGQMHRNLGRPAPLVPLLVEVMGDLEEQIMWEKEE